MQTIKILPQHIVNQIAAGEVIERPFSVVKELVENAIDAGATEITVSIVDGGKNFISVSDNGSGMSRDSLEMCVMSHATSKLSSENLFDIHTFGFRGEALPSIASVSRLSITTSDNEIGEAWQLRIEGQNILGINPSSRSRGTTIEVRDLFFATPARLKFLKSESYETEKCRAIFDDLALANHDIAFKFIDSGKEKVHYKKTNDLKQRVYDVFGETFSKNVFDIKVKHENLMLYGYIGIPTFNKSVSASQYFFVNDRLVKDKVMASALRSAYAGLIPHGRYPVAALYLNVPFSDIDVNVHPAKTEIRFKEPEKIRSFILSELKKSIETYGSNRSTTDMMDRFYTSASNKLSAIPTGIITGERKVVNAPSVMASVLPKSSSGIKNIKTKTVEYDDMLQSPVYHEKSASVLPFPSADKYNISEKSLADFKNNVEKNNSLKTSSKSFPLAEKTESIDEKNRISLGNAVAQINNTYIIAENDNGIIIVDQHAAAERIMLEELKNSLKLKAQNLLIPETLILNTSQIDLLKSNGELLTKLGIYIDYLDSNEIAVTSVPALLETSDAVSLLDDILDELSAFGDTYTLDDKIHKILSTISCHSSLRAGKRLTFEEMNYLLKKMECTTNIAQCCHGRPSYITLTIKDLNNFFERS
ncbi:MAG: DNA mismatch repair endonuclease MutL [Alphaproteobacteria bacterium]|nr:DNA mismatch repair endonuclease MutL [Alphaproteobacteria bacterium]